MLSASNPLIRMAGYRGASHSGEIGGLDLFLTDDPVALLYAHAAARFSYIAEIMNGGPGNA